MGSVMACWKEEGENREIEFALESFAILKEAYSREEIFSGE